MHKLHALIPVIDRERVHEKGEKALLFFTLGRVARVPGVFPDLDTEQEIKAPGKFRSQSLKSASSRPV